MSTRGGDAGRWRGMVLSGPALWVMVAVVGVMSGVVAVSVYRTLTVSPAERVVRIDTTACGHSSATSGVGVVVGSDLVLTAAHTVSGAGEVVVATAVGSKESRGTVVAYDQRSDLALVAVVGIPGDGVDIAETSAGDEVKLLGTGPGVVTATVTKRAEVRIEGVRSSERGSRFGFLLDVEVALGDSGAPVFDLDDRLVGIVFGRSESGTFAVRAEEIEAILAAPETEWVCEASAHELVQR